MAVIVATAVACSAGDGSDVEGDTGPEFSLNKDTFSKYDAGPKDALSDGAGEVSLPSDASVDASVAEVKDATDIAIADVTDVLDSSVEADEGVVADLSAGPCKSHADCAGKVEVGLCELAVCDKSTGLCMPAKAPELLFCDDGDPCTLGDHCVAGACVASGQVAACDDGNACTLDSCDAVATDADPLTGCLHVLKAGACDDGDPCTTDDTCAAGVCAGTPKPECACTTDGDCLKLDDGNLCNGTLLCKDGLCAVDPATVVPCQKFDASSCQKSICNPSTGKCTALTEADGTPCDDQSLCTLGDACLDGECTAAKKICDCASEGDCAAYEDGNACNGTLTCKAGKCQHKVDSIVVCPASPDPCLEAFCSPKSGKCSQKLRAKGTPCEDGNPCTLGDTCDGAGGCAAGKPNLCDDGNPCTQDACTPDPGCASTPVPDGVVCDDGDKCTIGEACAGGACGGGEPNTCDDVNPCTKDACSSTFGCDHTVLIGPCDDGDKCTLGESCEDGICTSGAPVSCDDLNPCTTEACLKTDGCVYANNTDDCPDPNDPCPTRTCSDGKCNVIDNKCSNCATDEECLIAYTGNLCEGKPLCVVTKPETGFKDCQVDPTTVVQCDPSADKACVKNACSAKTGLCEMGPVADGAPCDDGDACTVNDTCVAGKCKAGKLGYGCSMCGDGQCVLPEDCKNCPADCGACQTTGCNNGKCEAGEDCSSCSADCGKCSGGCVALDIQYCASTINGSTSGTGVTDGIDVYTGCGNLAATGPERAYPFIAPCDGPISLTLAAQTNPQTAQPLNVLVLDSAKNCKPDACLKGGVMGTGQNKITFTAVKNKTYYIVVDSASKPAPFSLTVSCDCMSSGSCGDGKCDAPAETCSNCAKDCGACVVCGDGKCEATKESCTTCPADCGACVVCGDGKCEATKESCTTCPADCGACVVCGDGKCEAGKETCSGCPGDCGACAACGDGKCEAGKETCSGCPADCCPPNACAPTKTLTCGENDTSSFTAAGATSAVKTWMCLTGDYGGKEYAYTVKPSCNGTIVVKVKRDAGSTGAIDLFVVDTNKVCDGTSCLALGVMPVDTAVASFPGSKDVEYKAILDTKTPAPPDPPITAAFQFLVSCNCVTCGNAKCEAGESCTNCPGDCTCPPPPPPAKPGKPLPAAMSIDRIVDDGRVSLDAFALPADGEAWLHVSRQWATYAAPSVFVRTLWGRFDVSSRLVERPDAAGWLLDLTDFGGGPVRVELATEFVDGVGDAWLWVAEPASR